jgi:ribosomal protein S4
MVLFRLRFLPTIYGCHQFIHHFGININGKKEKSPYALVRAGDIITFEKEH